MRPDLSDSDLAGLMLQHEQALEDARDDDPPPSRINGFLVVVGFAVALVLVVLGVRWSFAG